MKKWLILIVILLLGIFTAYRLLHKQEDVPVSDKEAPLSISKNSDAFNLSFGTVMNHYYALRDAFVARDTILINKASLALAQSLDSLPLKKLKADTALIETAASLSSSVSGELKGLEGESSLEEKQRSFNMVTDELYGLIRTVRYDRERIYHIKCTSAFKDSSEVYWLGNASSVVNPYLGKDHPGEITDSLDFSGSR